MACTPADPTFIYTDTLQELKVYLKSNNELIDISEDIRIDDEANNTTLTIKEYLDIATRDTYDEQFFKIKSQEKNLIHSDFIKGVSS